jgi:hypothetical protein
MIHQTTNGVFIFLTSVAQTIMPLFQTSHYCLGTPPSPLGHPLLVLQASPGLLLQGAYPDCPGTEFWVDRFRVLRAD